MPIKKIRQYKGILYSVFNKIKRNAAARKIPFEITIEYIGDLFEKQNKKCALTGIELTLKTNFKDKTQTASLDRKDSKKGYIKENLQWILKDLNRMKGTFTVERFRELCMFVVRKNI